MKKLFIGLVLIAGLSVMAQVPYSADFLTVKAIVVTNAAASGAFGVTNLNSYLYGTNTIAAEVTPFVFTNLAGVRVYISNGVSTADNTNKSAINLFKDVELAPFYGSDLAYSPIYSPTNDAIVDWPRVPIKIVVVFSPNANAAVSTLQFKPVWADGVVSSTAAEWLTFTATTAAGTYNIVQATNIPITWAGAKAVRCDSVSTAAAAGDSNVFHKIMLTGYLR